jgi:NADP-dependent 3-hydroxy acid dehydrogenase YdfG
MVRSGKEGSAMTDTDITGPETLLRPLAGTAALVTGASSGIGAATALEIARQGGRVAVVARREERLAELTETIEREGGAATAFAADLTDTEQAEAAVAEAADRLGRLDIVVNNAGQGARSPVEDADPADWERMVDVNVTSLLRLSRAALPHLLRAAAQGPRRVADIVNVSSVAGRIPRKDNSVYSATKHAVVAFSEALRQEVTGRRVRVGVVEPGMTRSEMTLGPMSSAARGMPPEDWLAADDVARAILFMITQPRRAAVNEILLRPTVQEH